MSKDIWHKPSETTDVDNNLIIDDWTNGTYELGYFDDNDMVFRNFRNDDIHDEESMMRWCDVDDLIHDYKRTRKALDVAKDALDAGKTLADIAGFKMLVAGLEEALNKITALEQKD